MRPDPRCPSCDGKVSATAQWCMHCGRDFESPVDANDGGRVSERERDRGDGGSGLGSILDAGSDSGGTVTVGESTAAVDQSTGTVDGSTGTVDDATGTIDASTGAVETNVETDIGESSVETDVGESGSRTRPSGTSLSGAGLLRAVVGSVVDYVGVSEDRREAVALGVPALVWLWAQGALGSPGGAAVAAGLLAVVLYTRDTAGETLAAALYGSGLVFALVPVLAAGRAVLAGSTATLRAALPGTGWFLFAVALIMAGAWLHGQEF